MNLDDPIAMESSMQRAYRHLRVRSYSDARKVWDDAADQLAAEMIAMCWQRMVRERCERMRRSA